MNNLDIKQIYVQIWLGVLFFENSQLKTRREQPNWRMKQSPEDVNQQEKQVKEIELIIRVASAIATATENDRP